MKIYLITNRKLVSNEEEFLQVIKECSENGVDNIILREKDLGFDDLVKLGYKAKEVIDENKTKLILNSNIECGIKLKAYGIHLPFQEFIRVDNKQIYSFK
jgi:thiamine monophosphate synthase